MNVLYSKIIANFLSAAENGGTSSSSAAAPTDRASANTTPPSTKFTLSLKSQSELLAPKKGDSPSANMLADGGSSSSSGGGGSGGDSLTVSKISIPSSTAGKAVAASSAAAAKPPGTANITPPNLMVRTSVSGNMPGLHPRPNSFLRSAGSSTNLPLSSATSVSEQLNIVAGGIADYMRHGIEEILRELSAQGSSEATIKGRLGMKNKNKTLRKYLIS